MKTIKLVTILPIWVEQLPPFNEFKDNEFYISEKYKTSSHRCLCGCGEKTVLPFNKEGQTYFWDLVKEKNGTISIIGSVGNFQIPCKSHYIITKNVANFV